MRRSRYFPVPKPHCGDPIRVVLPAENSPVLTNGHAEPHQEAEDGPGDDSERILVFRSSLFSEAKETELRPFCGFRTDAPEMAGRLFPKGVSSGDFRLRTKAPHLDALEEDRSWKQVVACVVPWHAATGQVWTFRRGSSEGRLDGRISCLVGGHVNFADAYPEDLTDGKVGLIPHPDLLEVTFATAVREMGEELSNWEHNWKNYHSDCRLVLMGVVHDDSDPVGAVHFGIIYRLDVAKLEIPMKFAEEAGESAGWLPVDDLVDGLVDGWGSVETWSVHVARYLREFSPIRHSG
jgi:predicted NUDIX family phosphoesterase